MIKYVKFLKKLTIKLIFFCNNIKSLKLQSLAEFLSFLPPLITLPTYNNFFPSIMARLRRINLIGILGD